ncbi:DnaD domain-containing protein [Aquibacillus salsiterrae]|uniref:DnaD domain protein n=1 Tax=Aquibacillus salsiterrae TaxID=2950439 RepID=A0A9X4AHP7_9BACI|nr:DnaD domain protein [Aquibacillus salsiterrae]MDC3418555.1 DnaD domain protein [Aquibacillus salsiterrae]
MNYIKQLNAFYNQLDFNPLSNNAILLWHSLMQINNKTGWKQEFTVAAKVITAKIQLNESAFKRARTELQEKGYIHCQSRSGNLAPVYQIICLTIEHDCTSTLTISDDLYPVTETNNHMQQQIPNATSSPFVSVNAEGNVTGESNDKLNNKPTVLTKQDIKEIKTKQSHETITTQAESFYEQNIGKVTPFIQGLLSNWTSTLNEPLVIEAMKQSVERNHANWKYIESILKAWRNKNLATLEQVESDQQAFKQQRQAQFPSKNYPKQEVIPDWFHNRNKKVDAPAHKTNEPIDIEKRLREYTNSKGIG